MRYKGLGIVGLVVASTWGTVGIALIPHELAAADDAGSDRLRAAEKDYRNAIARARNGLLDSFESEVESAKTSPRLKAGERALLVDRIGRERDAFRDSGRIPVSPRMKDEVKQYRKALQRAEDLCRRQFDAAARIHREAGDRAAETEVIESWERLFLETADLEAFPDRWLPLFNGRSLNGWFVERGDEDAWSVEAGALVAQGGQDSSKVGFLLTEREFRDYTLGFEFQLGPDSDSGVALRAVRDEPSHLELNLRSVWETPSFHGYLFWSLSGNARDGLQPRPIERASGPWNQAVIESRGGLLRVTINGRWAHSTDLRWFTDMPEAAPGVSRESGHLGFQSSAGVARFRNIKVRGVPRTEAGGGTGWLPGPADAAIPETGRFYWLINEETGKALDVRHSTLVGGGGGPLVQAGAAERPSQAWMLLTRRERYQIINGNSHLMINIPLGRQEDGNGLIQWPDQNGAGNELWALIPEGRAFRITSTSGLVIIVNDLGRVEMRTPQGKRNELWRFVPVAP